MICCVVEICWESDGVRGEGVTVVMGEMTDTPPAVGVWTGRGVRGEVRVTGGEGGRKKWLEYMQVHRDYIAHTVSIIIPTELVVERNW